MSLGYRQLIILVRLVIYTWCYLLQVLFSSDDERFTFVTRTLDFTRTATDSFFKLLYSTHPLREY